jgi:PHP family Zn ribbon phosphoesterase
MSPENIINKAVEKEIQVLALTDHNSALNCKPLAELAEQKDIIFLSGMEVTTREEVHIICLFDNINAALELGELIYSRMASVKNDPLKSGDQLQVNGKGEILTEIDKYLNLAADISIQELEQAVHQLNGLLIAAHIDRPAYGIIETLGFLPDVNFDALELSASFYDRGLEKNEKYRALLKTYHCYQSSDAHYLQDIGRNSVRIKPGDPIFKYLLP